MQLSRWQKKRFDVVVCGAGSAGCAAAFGASSAGARTLLVERLGFCGGTPVAAGIHTLDAIHSCQNPAERVVGGFATKLIERTISLGGAATKDNPEEALTLSPEHIKVAYDMLLREAGVEVVFHALAIDAMLSNNCITGLELALLDGRSVIDCDSVIDCTGDAALVFQSGAMWERDTSLQALTYHFRLGNVLPGRNWDWLENVCREAVERHAPEGFIYGGPWIIRLNDNEISLNGTRVFGNPVDPEQRSRAEQQARADMLHMVEILQREVPELSHSYLVTGATDLHVRESRKLCGEYTLTEDDIANCRPFEDAIAFGAWPFDIHPTDGFVGVHPHKESPPRPYGIPYRCLVPRTLDGLLVAGKAISTTHMAHGSTRVPGTSMATGQAAGVAAALATRNKSRLRDIDVNELRAELFRQGAILPKQPVSKS